jgi:hypothetical protein
MASVTVCVPVYNGEKFIRDTLAAIQRQTLADIRILVSIDLGDDTSLNICRTLQSEDARIEVFEQKTRLGFWDNINFLIQQVETDFFCITPHDDLLEPDFLTALLQPMLEDDSVALTYADMDRGPGTHTEFQGPLPGGQSVRVLGFLTRQINHVEWRGLIRSRYTSTSFTFSYGDTIDQLVPLKLACRGTLVRVPRVLYHKTMHPTSTVAHQRTTEWGNVKRLYDSFISCFECFRYSVEQLENEGLRRLAEVALLLRCLNVVEINWPLHGPGLQSKLERQWFGGLVDRRVGIALLVYDWLRLRPQLKALYPNEYNILMGSSLFHLALVAEHSSTPEDACALMQAAADLDPDLYEYDEFHHSACSRILPTHPSADPDWPERA